MFPGRFNRRSGILFFTLLLILLLSSACNLNAAPEEQLNVTDVPTGATNPTRTPASTSGAPTARAVTNLPLPTLRPGSTSVAINPQPILLPTATPLPVSIVILSPIPGNIVANNVQVLGAASHPQFLQYQVEYGPDPNPGNLWYPATGVVQAPLTTYSLLGVWNTTTIPDGIYQLRLRVFLRDGTSLQTVVNSIRVQNQAPTPIPTNTPTIPRPIAAFTQNVASGNAPLVVNFFNQSTGEITGYNWTFGDGGFATEQNPIHIFNTPGVYNVTLTVTGPGGSSNVSRQISVQSVSAPVAGFTQDRTTGAPPLNVQFTNQSTGNISRYEWNFGDGTTTSEASPLHTFSAVGTYNVILTVFGPGGSSSTTRQITVVDNQVAPPVAAFSPSEPVSGTAPLTLQFQNASTGNITSYNWNFGDRQTSPDPNPAHTFTDIGTFTVTLTVAGPGGQDTAELNVEVLQAPDAPTADFTIDGDPTGTAPFTVVFNNTSEGRIDRVLWDFGDGTTSESADDRITHEFTNPGTYTVVLTVSNESGQNSKTETLTALPQAVPVEARFSANPTTGTAPLEVTFTNESQGDNLTYRWDFGDTTTSETSEATFTHRYETSGDYTVQLFASNAETGETDDFRLSIQVAEPVVTTPLNVSLTVTETTPLNVTVSASVTGGTEPYTYQWDFGDGSTGQGQTLDHTYGAIGDYTISVTATDSAGTAVTAAQVIGITLPVEPLTATLTAIETTPLTFTLDATISGGTEPYTAAWDFGDGTSGSGISVQHTFVAGGTYTVVLTVTDANGETAANQQQVTAVEAETPGQQETTPTLPVDINSYFRSLNPVYQAGLSLPVPNRRDAFTVIGAVPAAETFLGLFAINDPPTYRTDESTQALESLITAYNSTGSFSRQSLAAGGNVTLRMLLEPGANFSSQCDQPGENLLQCELRLAQASIVLVSPGYNEILSQTDPAAFAEDLRQVIQTTLNNGVVPIVMTVFPLQGSPEIVEQTRRINDEIINVANSLSVPIFNQWAAFNSLPERGLTGANTPTIDPNAVEGAGYLTTNSSFGANTRNTLILQLLNSVYINLLR